MSWCATKRSGWMVSKACAQKRLRLNKAWANSEAVEELPPAVAAAQKLMAQPENDRANVPVASSASRSDGSNGPLGVTAWMGQMDGGKVMNREAPNPGPGEVLGEGLGCVQLRRRGPRVANHWLQNGSEKRPKPCLSKAISLASDEARMEAARLEFMTLRYAAGTLDTKDSLFRTWCEVSTARGFEPLPVTADKLVEVSSVLRASGYRSGLAYILEAKRRHLRHGFAWGEHLDVIVKDCKRAFTRAIGPARKASEVRLEWLQTLWNTEGNKVGVRRDDRMPEGGLLVWALGIHWVLREVELACLTLHEDVVVRLQSRDRQVTILLTSSKSDPAGRGCRRTLRCCGRRSCEDSGLECPYFVACSLIEMQERSTGVSRSDERARGLPLIGQTGSPMSFVDKDKMIEAAKEDAVRVKDLVEQAQQLDISAVTGHFMRRTGCKRYARNGMPLDIIKHMSRHSSSAVEGYVEEALEEDPGAQSKLSDFQQVQKALTEFRQDLEEIREKQQVVSIPIESETDSKLIEQVAKMKDELGPQYIRNRSSQKVHSTFGCQFSDAPSTWSTRCGWKWVSAGRQAVACGATEIKSFKLCDKCFAQEDA